MKGLIGERKRRGQNGRPNRNHSGRPSGFRSAITWVGPTSSRSTSRRSPGPDLRGRHDHDHRSRPKSGRYGACHGETIESGSRSSGLWQPSISEQRNRGSRQTTGEFRCQREIGFMRGIVARLAFRAWGAAGLAYSWERRIRVCSEGHPAERRRRPAASPEQAARQDADRFLPSLFRRVPRARARSRGWAPGVVLRSTFCLSARPRVLVLDAVAIGPRGATKPADWPGRRSLGTGGGDHLRTGGARAGPTCRRDG